MKKIIGVTFITILLILIVGGTVIIVNNKKAEQIKNNINEIEKTKEEEKEHKQKDSNDEQSKTLVVYFSAENHTKNVALKIKDTLNTDIFEVIPKVKYTKEDLDYNNINSRVSKEHNDKALQDIELEETTVENWNAYTTIFIGYPIWWGDSAWPINTFVKNNDFTNKKVIPFCTSSSSGIGNSAKNLSSLVNTGTWQDGICFTANMGDSDITTWLESLK